MNPAGFRLCFAIALAVSLYGVTAADDLGIRAPEHFAVSLFADDELAHDIYSMTFDSQGRVVVAGANYIKTLHDDDGDGRADRASLFSDKPASGAHGLLFDGGTLYATGDHGIWKFTDADLDGVADGPPEKWVDGLSHREHGCNGIIRGPDGWIYVVCGNDAGVNENFASTPDSPVRKPNCGAILRFSSDGKESEIVAHGFRNPYDICFHPHGNLFTVDADGERDHHLPWYSPNRLFDVATGMHHGWVLTGWQWSWNRPASYFDNVERCAEIGRGSPTGMLCYRHTQFPEKYRGGIFSACWTMGRIYHYPLTPRGSTFDGKVEVFLETTGETGFAPVDMEVGADGSMYVAIGGRGTRGSIFKVTYGGPATERAYEPSSVLGRVLDAPQPQSAWSRAKWVQEAKKLAEEDFQAAALNSDLPTAWRIRALEYLSERMQPLADDAADRLIADSNSNIAARAAWYLGRIGSPKENARALIKATKQRFDVVQRAAWEALVNNEPSRDVDVEGNWNPLEDRRCRAARILALAKGWKPAEGETNKDFAAQFGESYSTDAAWLAYYEGRLPEMAHRSPGLLQAITSDSSRARQQDVIRLSMLTFGDIAIDPADKERLAGYAFPPVEKADAARSRDLDLQLVAAGVGHSFAQLDMSVWPEAARLLAMTGAPASGEAIESITVAITTTSSPVDDIHYLMCLSRIPGPRTDAARQNIAAGIARLDSKMKTRGWYPSRNWPDRVGETFTALAKHDPELPQAVIEHADFNSPTQAFLFTRLPDHQASAARKLLKCIAESDEEVRWTTELVSLVAALPKEESLPALRGAWEDFAMQDAIALQLVKSPHIEDRGRLIEALGSIDVSVIEKSAEAIKSLEIKPTDEEVLAAVRALRQSCFAPPNRVARQALMRLLASWSGEDFNIKEKGDDHFGRYKPVFDWFGLAHPNLAAQLREASGDAAAWRDRLANVDWTSGDADRGRQVFEKRNCVKCHAGTSPLGPDLAGAAGRLSREDLFAAIVDPSKDVAPLYQATQIVTGSGRVYHGLVVYESPDGTLLTTGPDTTIRIAGDEVTLMRKSRVSLMPTGLLTMATDQELADLHTYLQTLKGKR